MKPRTSRKEVHQFKGVMNYYRNMWERNSHTLASLTKITPIKVKFKWTKIEQDVFYKIKLIVSRHTLLTYSYSN